MSYPGNCQRCSGLLVEEHCEASTEFEWRCLQCGARKPPAIPIPAPPAPLAGYKPSKSTRKRKSPHALKVVSVPTLSPPPVPRTNEDWEGSYTIQCHTYAGYQHFRGLAGYYRKEVSRCRLKNDKLTANYRARLCENLAATLGKIYARQTRTWLRDRLRKEQRAGRDNVEKLDRTLKSLHKQHADFMLQAMSHLPDDPVVRRFHGHMKALGQWDYLRKARQKLEHGVKRPFRSTKEADIDTEIKVLHSEGKGARKIFRSLKNRAATWEGQRGTKKIIKVQPTPFSVTSFHTHQAIEKRIKALKKASDK